MVSVQLQTDTAAGKATDTERCAAVTGSTTQALLPISLAYAPTPEQQHYQQLQLPEGSSLFDALKLAGWLERFPDLAQWCEQVAEQSTPTAKQWHVGIFSQKQPLNYRLQAHDRVEVYRSLQLDPMGKRKKRAIKKRQS